MSDNPPSDDVEELAAPECMHLLDSVSVGRVGVTIEALPAVFPVRFVVSEGAVIFRTVPGTKFDAATAESVVAFEADAEGTAADPTRWSVLVRGIARPLTEPEDVSTARALPLGSWAWEGRADRFVRIYPTVITGWRVAERVPAREHARTGSVG
jgi:nitroimidazol reductase NimA-like FMN-containing flavoprotein (pyridoxamine 5'-phosphate oxidase superfamily)